PVVLDTVGAVLDGEFNGQFPSGNGVPGGSFSQDLGIQTLLAPTVTSLRLQPADPTAVPPIPTSDSGIGGDENTNITTPRFVGQVGASSPATLSGLTVLAEFNSLHGGNLDLNPGPNGRGFIGSFDATARTDSTGKFVIQAPALFEGYQLVR